MIYDFPYKSVPDSWPLNDVFLRALDKAMRVWSDKGYSWQFGLELEFFSTSIKEIKVVSDYARKRSAYSNLQASYNASRERLSNKKDHDFTPDARAALAQIKTWLASETNDKLYNVYGQSREAMATELQAIEDNLQNDDAEIRDHAMANIVMAWLYCKDGKDGGLKDKAEPRFGDYCQGLGWWDNEGVGEIRLRESQPSALIGGFHKTIVKITQASERFGRLPTVFAGSPHIHFSLWDAQGRNLMESGDEDALVLRERILTGIYHFTEHAPLLVHDFEPSAIGHHQSISAGGNRKHGLRQLSDNWEYRRSFGDSACHLAKELLTIIGGAAHGCFGPDVPKDNPYKIERKTLPIIRHRLGLHNSGLKSSLENCFIDPDSGLHIDIEVLRNNYPSMMAEVGKHTTSLFKGIGISKKECDLRHADGWLELFKSLKINDDHVLNVAHLDPELQAAFGLLDIQGRRTILRGIAPTPDPSPDLMILTADALERNSALQFLMPEEDVQSTAQFFKHYQAQYLGRIASILTDSIAEQLRTLPDETEDPTETLVQFCYEKIMSPSIAEIAQAYATNEQAIEDGTYKPPSEKVTKEKTAETPCFYKAIAPLFNQAVRQEIVQLRTAPHPDNRHISMLEATSEFLEKKLLDINLYSTTHLERVFQTAEHLADEEKLSPYLQAMLSIGLHYHLIGFFEILLTDPDKTLGDCMTIAERCKSGHDAIYIRLAEKFIKAAIEGTKDSEMIDFLSLCYSTTNKVYQSVQSTFGTMLAAEQKKAGGPSPPA